jgi:hypothetical protein
VQLPAAFNPGREDLGLEASPKIERTPGATGDTTAALALARRNLLLVRFIIS